MTMNNQLQRAILKHWIEEFKNPQLPNEKKLLRMKIIEMTKKIQKDVDNEKGNC